MTDDAQAFLDTTITALGRMSVAGRARCAAALINAVQGPGARPIAQLRWTAIAHMHETGMSMEDIAAELDMSAGAVDLALQTHFRTHNATV